VPFAGVLKPAAAFSAAPRRRKSRVWPFFALLFLPQSGLFL
jgi:hypothetical protein